MSENSDARARRMRVIGSLTGIPTTLAAGALVGFFLGRWLDDRLGTAPWLQLVLLGLGLASAVRTARRLLKKVEKEFDQL